MAYHYHHEKEDMKDSEPYQVSCFLVVAVSCRGNIPSTYVGYYASGRGFSFRAASAA